MPPHPPPPPQIYIYIYMKNKEFCVCQGNRKQCNTFIKTKPIFEFSSHDSYNLLSRATYKIMKGKKKLQLKNLPNGHELKWTNSHKEKVMENGENVTKRKKKKNHRSSESIESRRSVENGSSWLSSSLNQNLKAHANSKPLRSIEQDSQMGFHLRNKKNKICREKKESTGIEISKSEYIHRGTTTYR